MSKHETGDKICCLLIHGFAGSVREVSPLAEYLSEKGYATSCVRLSGHTGNKSDLAGSDNESWIRSAEEALLDRGSSGERLFLIGFSMGGLIAIHLAQKYRLDGIVTLNMPIYYWDVRKFLNYLSKDFRTGRFETLKRYFRSSIDMPLEAVFNFRALLEKTKPLLRKTSCPLSIHQSLEDDVVHSKSAEFIYQNAGSKKKKVKYYPGAGHMICHSSASGEVFRDVEVFLRSTGREDPALPTLDPPA